MQSNFKSPIPQYNPLKSNTFIPEKAVHVPQSQNPEDTGFLISFQYYRDDICEIKLLVKNGGKRALENLRAIGKSYNEVSLKDNHIDTKNVQNCGEYKKLYSGLSPDIDIREHKILSTARLFYFFVDKYFYIRAIKNSHFETEKHR